MPSLVYANCQRQCDGTVLTHGASGFVRTMAFRVEKLTQDADYIAAGGLSVIDPLDFAICLPVQPDRDRIPQRGDVRTTMTAFDTTSGPTLLSLYCMDVKARHIANSKDTVLVECTLAELGIPVGDDGTLNASANIFSWLVAGAIGGTTVAAETSFGYDTSSQYGQLLQVYYKKGTPNYDYSTDSTLTASISIGDVLSQYVKVPSLESLGNLQLSMREITSPDALDPNLATPQAKQKYYNGAVNSADIWDYPAGTLRLRITVGNFDALRSISIVPPDDDSVRRVVWDVDYTFEYRARGWAEIATLKLPYTGFEPPDADNPVVGIAAGHDHGNGWAKFSNNLLARDFSDLGLPDLRAL